MTAPAAALIQRPLPKRDGVRETATPARQAQAPATDQQATGSFAAYLERGSPRQTADQPSVAPIPASDTLAAMPVAISSANPDAAPLPEPATEAATGKILPDTRQAAAKPATQTILVILTARAASDSEDASIDTAKTDAEASTTDTAESAVLVVPPQLPVGLAAPAVPAQAVPLRAATPAKAVPSTSPGTAPPIVPGRPAAAPAAGTPDAPAANAAAMASAPAATAAAPALSFILERDGPVASSPEPTAADTASDTAVQPGTDQTAARAQPSTLAALTRAATADRPALRRVRADAETVLPGLKTETAELTASAFALAQPASSPAAATTASAGPAVTAQPPEGIGFDALVDSIARARDGAPDGAPVAVAMRHAEFGRISMRFQSDADGMSVAMTSPDPTFAPAVAAAHAAEAAANTEPAPRPSQTGTASGDPTGGQMQGGARSGSGQRQDSPQQPRSASEPARTAPRTTDTPADDRQGGIFA